MHLITPLACGVAGAEDGSVNIYVRGSGTRAQIWTSFEADGATIPTAPTPLDANGGATIYVDQVVDVRVYDSTGTLVREFTDGQAAPNTEVISQSFTGIDYETGVSGASKPVDLGTVLDLWKTSAGALDFEVLVSGVSTSLESAMGVVSGLFYNVKDPAYDAKGTGSADDTSAIQDAINAAEAANGGIVFFPPGIYKITSALTMGTRVSLMGAGANASRILRDHGSNHALSYASAISTNEVFVQDLMFYDNQNNSGDVLHVTVDIKIVVSRCKFGSGTTTRGKIVGATDAGAHIHLDRCLITMGDDSATQVCDVASMFTMTHCQVTVGSASTGTVVRVTGTNSRIIGNYFDCSANTGSAEVVGFYHASQTTGTRICAHNHFTDAASGTIKAMNFTRPGFSEFGNSFGSTYDGTTAKPYGAFSNVTASATAQDIGLYSRIGRTYIIASDAAEVDPSPGVFGTIVISRTTSTNQIIGLNPPFGPGEFTLMYTNGAAAPIAAVTLTTAEGLASFAIVNGTTSVFKFQAFYSGSWRWAYVSGVTGVV